jgi:hypothetical protein
MNQNEDAERAPDRSEPAEPKRVWGTLMRLPRREDGSIDEQALDELAERVAAALNAVRQGTPPDST